MDHSLTVRSRPYRAPDPPTAPNELGPYMRAILGETFAEELVAQAYADLADMGGKRAPEAACALQMALREAAIKL